MQKSEYATDLVGRFLDGRGPVALTDLVSRASFLTDDGDPRWVGVALSHLTNAGKARYLTCDGNHNHDGSCQVEAVA